MFFLYCSKIINLGDKPKIDNTGTNTVEYSYFASRTDNLKEAGHEGKKYPCNFGVQM